MADSIVESGSSSVSIQAPTVSGHNINPIPIIAAEIIQMDTSNPPPRPPPDDSCAEPEPKRKKIESAVASTSGINEKLELRLGGILCCAVCLDLPKTAMYQVGMSLHNFSAFYQVDLAKDKFFLWFFVLIIFCVILGRIFRGFRSLFFGRRSEKTIFFCFVLSHRYVMFMFRTTEKRNVTNALQISVFLNQKFHFIFLSQNFFYFITLSLHGNATTHTLRNNFLFCLLYPTKVCCLPTRVENF